MNPWLGKLVYIVDSFRGIDTRELGIVYDMLPKADGGENCLIMHANGQDSAFSPKSLREYTESDADAHCKAIIKGLELHARTAAERYILVQQLVAINKKRNNPCGD